MSLASHCLAEKVLKIRGGPVAAPPSPFSALPPRPPSHAPFPIHIRLYKRGRTTVGPKSSGALGCRVLRVMEGQISTGGNGGYGGYGICNPEAERYYGGRRQQIFHFILSIIDPIFGGSERSTSKLKNVGAIRRTTGPHVKPYRVLVYIDLPHSPGIGMRDLARVRYSLLSGS